jgi:hypothetical protein
MARSIEDVFLTDVRTPPLEQRREPTSATGFASLPSECLQEIGSNLVPKDFRATSTVCKSLQNALAFTAPGLKAARADGEVSLYEWQASNVRALVAFLQSNFRRRHNHMTPPRTEGYVLCDAPGGGKTVSVLATVVRTIAQSSVVLIFAPKVIVSQWSTQIARHFCAEPSGLHLFSDASQVHLYDETVQALSDRAEVCTAALQPRLHTGHTC